MKLPHVSHYTFGEKLLLEKRCLQTHASVWSETTRCEVSFGVHAAYM